MWRTKTADPLGKLLFEKYHMHILARPRENVSVFQIFGVRDGEALQAGSIESFLRSSFEKPEVVIGEKVLDIDGTTSDAVSAQTGLSFLQGFLGIFGAVGTSLTAAVERSNSQALRFQFGGCTRDRVKDDFDLEWAISEVEFPMERSPMKPDYRYFIASGVHHCTQLTFEALTKNMAKVDLSAEVAALGAAKAGVSVNHDRQVVAKSDRTLVYGVELSELVYDEKRKRLRLEGARSFVHTRGDDASTLPRASITNADDVMMLRIVDS